MRLPRWLRLMPVTLVTVVAAALLALYSGSEYILRRRYTVTGQALNLPTDSSALEAGRHLVTLRGCLGCHGAQGEGQVFFSEPRIATIVAPNLIRAMTTCSDAEPEGIIRHGVRPNGRTVLGMPSSAFLLLRDDDFARVITFLRSIPRAEGPGPTCRSVRSVGLACSRASSRWEPRWSARRSARGVRELRLMSGVARARFSQVNDAELQALFA